jgi:hypothetical protein
VHELSECPHPRKPILVRRNLYVALRDEVLPDLMALNRVLEPHLDTLFRLAARGHWMRERRPVRPTFKTLAPKEKHLKKQVGKPKSAFGHLSTMRTSFARSARMQRTSCGKQLRRSLTPQIVPKHNLRPSSRFGERSTGVAGALDILQADAQGKPITPL